IPAVHASGNSAEGIIIGMFDNGVRLPGHEAFDLLRPRIIAQHDFVDHKTSVIPNDTAPGFGDHGVYTLSTIAGYKPGKLIGPAYGASFILARTENDSSETPIEEDNWVAAVEWAESLGVQVTSTSLVYLGFDPGWPSLTWQDMNGRTAVISIAALMAARKGVVVVTSAGNDGQTGSGLPNTLNAPADADSILSVGAVTPFGVRAGFSSYGPTSDGRIKPDVMAVGTSMQAADAYDTGAYTEGSEGGTSFSCPLTAGVAALVLKAHPEASSQAVVAAIRSTAHQAQAQTTRPDNYYGWGIVDAVAAINALGPVIPVSTATSYQLLQNFPNPFNPGTTVGFVVPEQADVTIAIYDLLGRRVRTLLHDTFAATWTAPYTKEWDGRDDGGRPVATGVYICRMEARGASGMTSRQVMKMMLVR
ncbi:MAG TPA: S8 family serine peptidase, partial [Bacteroidota bacterium]|nr:S8 family serine peptidase [Bacteroidota bacterium]